jgi:hypothetical protein
VHLAFSILERLLGWVAFLGSIAMAISSSVGLGMSIGGSGSKMKFDPPSASSG